MTEAATSPGPTEQKVCEVNPHAIFAECPHCGGDMSPEHAHYRCTSCGWRDSCCD